MVQKRRILILCPPSLIANWIDEVMLFEVITDIQFKKWVPEYHFNLLQNIFVLNNVTAEKIALIKNWHYETGILIMGYEVCLYYCNMQKFRDLVFAAPSDSDIKTLLLDPGPAVVIADEAHRIKNPKVYILIIQLLDQNL